MTTLTLAELSRSARLALDAPAGVGGSSTVAAIGRGSGTGQQPGPQLSWWQRQEYRYVSRRERVGGDLMAVG